MSRPTTTKQVGGASITIEALPPRRGFRALAQAAKVFGPQISGLMSGGIRDPESGAIVTIADAAATEAGRALLARRVFEAVEAMDLDDLDDLIDTLLAGQVTINGTRVPYDPASPRVWSEAIDLLLPDPFAVFTMLRAALELNLRPTSAAGRTEGDTAAARS